MLTRVIRRKETIIFYNSCVAVTSIEKDQLLYELPHEKTSQVTCAPLAAYREHTKESDQTEWMSRAAPSLC